MTRPTPRNAAAPGRDTARNGKKIYWAVFAICAALLVVDLVYHKKAEIGVDGYFGFYAAFGFFGCVAAILVARVFGGIVRRGEDFYEPPARKEGEG